MVEPVEVPLGFFGEQELVVESVLLVDGYDSTEETYAEASASLSELQSYAEFLMDRAGQGMERGAVGSRGVVAADADRLVRRR